MENGSGRTPQILSIAGSLDAIEYWAATIVGALDLKQGEYSSLDGNELKIALGRLRSLRQKLDPKTQAYGDAVTVFGEHLVTLQNQRPSGSRLERLIEDIISSSEKAGREHESLRRDPEVMEQLIQ